MGTRKVAHAVASYQDKNGNWHTALRGAEVEVHADDLGRLESGGALEPEVKRAAKAASSDS